MHQISDELKFLNAKDLGILQSSIQKKLQKEDYVPYLDHLDNYVLSKLKWWKGLFRIKFYFIIKTFALIRLTRIIEAGTGSFRDA